MALACGALAPQAEAKDFAVKVYGDIGLGNSMSLTTSMPGISAKSSAYTFGADFGYTFWRKGANLLEANIGIGYTTASATFDSPAMSYDYEAPASADEDGNAYIRYTDLSAMSQKSSLGYLTVPIYLRYQYRFVKWVGVHAEAGFGLGFRCAGSAGSTSGYTTSYGVYPEYDNLEIKEDYLNAFGKQDLASASTGQAEMNGFSASVMCGAGFEFYVAEPVSIDLGIRYRAGLTDVYKGHYDVSTGTRMTAETAPVTYSARDGLQVKALSDYVTKSRLSPLSLHVGINIRF